MTTDFAGKVVVVTGASSGVGRAVARAFGAAGARVGLIARNEEALQNCVQEISASGGEAMALPTDVSDPDQVENAAAKVEARWGGIDIWVNDAMVSVFAPAKDITSAEVKRVTDVTYLGAVYGTQAAMRRMLPRDRGYVLQIGSALAYCSIPLQSAYCAAKAAMRGYTDSVRIELLHDRSNVRIGMVQLPAVNTPQFELVRSRLPDHPQPVPPIFQPEVIAQGVLYACANRSAEVWLGLPAIQAIVGRFFAPRFVDWFLARNGYRSQQTRALPPKAPSDNVFAPVPGDRGAHGSFDAHAKSFSLAIWARTHPVQVGAGLAALLLGVGLARTTARASR